MSRPDRYDDLRELAKALGRPLGDEGRARQRRRVAPGALYLVVAALAAAATFAWRALPPCGLGACAPTEPPARVRDRVAVALAPSDDRDGAPASPAATAEPAAAAERTPAAEPAPTADGGERLDTNRIATLLAGERGTTLAETDAPTRPVPIRTAPPTPAPTVHRAPSAVATVHHPIAVPSPLATALPEEPIDETIGAATSDEARPAERIASARRRDGWVGRAERDAYDPRNDARDRDEDGRPDVSGRWLLTNAIETTTHAPYSGMRVRFRVRLEQHGERVVGRGEKFTVDDRPVPPAQRTPITLEGTIRGREVTLRFVERGSRRTSRGGFHWYVSPDGRRLQGTFESTAAGARGRSHASRDG
jgi:hypothetical protein